MRLRAISIPALPGREGRYDRAPAAYEEAGLYGRLRSGRIEVVGPVGVVPPDEAELGEDQVANLGRLGARIGPAVAEGLAAGENVLLVGSNCTSLVGILAGFERAFGPAARIGLVWFDAHGDFNTPKTTISGMLGGMPVAVSAGLCLPAWREAAGLAAPIPTDRIVMVDVRNLDPKERDLLAATDVAVAAIAPGRPGEPLGAAVGRLASSCDAIYLHVDEDVLDARYVPNHGPASRTAPTRGRLWRRCGRCWTRAKCAGWGWSR